MTTRGKQIDFYKLQVQWSQELRVPNTSLSLELPIFFIKVLTEIPIFVVIFIKPMLMIKRDISEHDKGRPIAKRPTTLCNDWPKNYRS